MTLLSSIVYRKSDISFLTGSHSFAYGYEIKIGGSVWSPNSQSILWVLFSFTPTLRFTGTAISSLWHVHIIFLTATTSRFGDQFEEQTPREICFVFFHIHFKVYLKSDISSLNRFHSFAYGYHIKIGRSVWSSNSLRILSVFFSFISTLRFTWTAISLLWHILILLETATTSTLGDPFEPETPENIMFCFLSNPLWGLQEERYLLSFTFWILGLRLPHQDWGIRLKLKLPENIMCFILFSPSLWGLPEQRYLISDTFSFLCLRLPQPDWGIRLKLKIPKNLMSFFFWKKIFCT